MEPPKLRQKALALEESGNLQGALDLYAKLAATGEDSAGKSTIWNRIGTLQLRLGNEADGVTALVTGARLFAEADQPNNAIALYRKIIRAAPESAEAHLEVARLGQKLDYKRDAQEALDEYTRVKTARGESADAALDLRQSFESDEPPPLPPESPAADVSDLLVSNAPAEEEVPTEAPDVAPMEGLESSAGMEVIREEDADTDDAYGGYEPFEADSDEVADDDEVLPLLDVPVAEPAPREESRLDLLRRRVQVDETDLDGRVELVRLLLEDGQRDEALALAQELHAPIAAAGRYHDAAELAGLLIEQGTADTGLLQKRVEYASLSGEEDLLIAAYHSLAKHLEKSDGSGRAEVVYKRILEMDPQDEAAQKALKAAAHRESTREYVDFAAMVLEDESESGTRFTVDADEPTGDEDEDFAKILSVFKQKLSQHIDPADAASHYDLGLAFKEMGLLDEAVAEFQVALKAGANPIATLELLGECFCEQGRPTLTVRVLEYALKLKATDAEFLGVYYWLARAEATLGNNERAAEFFERITAVDIRFRDVAQRLQAIRGEKATRSL